MGARRSRDPLTRHAEAVIAALAGTTTRPPSPWSRMAGSGGRRNPMLEDPRLERIYEGIDLVNGVGDPAAGTMCVMSFVACLAGEGGTDSPLTASPVIRHFAIVVNDAMPAELRRRLKPFAPRIIGTNDGLDEIRTAILRLALAEEIVPSLLDGPRDTAAEARHRRGVLGRAWIRFSKGSLRRRITALLGETEYAYRPELGIELAHAAAQLIALCAREAAGAEEEAWCWGRAIGILDRLCGVGAEGRRTGVRADRLEWLEGVVAARGCIARGSGAEPTPLAAHFPGVL
jgi:hypothetical protein